jgi:methylated-DNA-[protein]-cysteine S-methyltransferase
MHETTYISPLGPIRLRADDDALLELTFGEGTPEGGGSPILDTACAQLDEYFAGTRTTFDLPLRLEGTPWEQRVWAELRQIGYGETASYGELAAKLGIPGAARAVGAANGRNPISIVVPCHRVIGARGALTGYAWGVERKSALLDLERGALSLMA